jgi:hypothetical protein
VQHSDGYMEALGATQASKVKREAEEGTAANVNAGREAVAKAKVIYINKQQFVFFTF